MSEIRKHINKLHREVFLKNDLYKLYTEKVVPDKKKYTRKKKHKKVSE